MTELAGDRRIRRSRAAILRAGREVLSEGAWEATSVAALCRRADVARSSFYLHVSGKPGLLDWMVSDALDRAPRQMAELAPVAGDRTLLWFAWHLRREAPLYRAAFRNDPAATASALREVLLAGLSRHRSALSRLEPDALEFLLGAVISQGRWWLEKRSGRPTPDLCRRLRTLALCLGQGPPAPQAMRLAG